MKTTTNATKKTVIHTDNVILLRNSPDRLEFLLERISPTIRQRTLVVSKKSLSYKNLLRCLSLSESDLEAAPQNKVLGKAAFALRLVETATHSYFIRVDFLPSVWS